MRGVFTCGVLDCFLDKGVFFKYVIGVSAGASNALSYLSRQRGRAKTINIDYLAKYRYIGLRHFFKSGCIMDYKLLFEEFPRSIYPFDFEAYLKSPERFVMSATNCLSGETEYFEKPDTFERCIDICRASCSMPFLCPIAYAEGKPLLDGGIADSIPLKKSVADGNAKNVVVLTRNPGYRKHPEIVPMPPFIYGKYPKLRKKIAERNLAYNRALEFAEESEKCGDALVIRPLKPIKVSRTEKDVRKLEELYREGYECAQTVIKQSLAGFAQKID